MLNWRPALTSNGWFPHLSPNGRYVLFGFWATGLADLATGQEWTVTAPAAADGHVPRLHPIGFLDNDTFIAVTEEGPAAVYRVPVATRVPEDLHVPNYIGASFGNAANGHWGLYLELRGQYPFCIKDGAPFHPEILQYGCTVNGDHLLTAHKDQGYVIMHFKGDQLIRELPTDDKWSVSVEGDVASGYYGAVDVFPWGQGYVDGTITPWRREGVPALIRVNGELWLWNACDSDGVLFIMGRRLGEKEPIILRDFPAVEVAVAWTGSEFIVAGNSDKGYLQVRSASIDQPRESLLPVVAPPDEAIMKSFERPFWVAPFKSHTERYGDTPLDQHVGNAIFVEEDPGNPGSLARELARIGPLNQPMIVGTVSQTPDPYWNNQIVAWWASGSDLAVCAASVERHAAFSEKPIIAYVDAGLSGAWSADRPYWVSDRVWPSVQVYRNVGESVDAFEHRITMMLDRVCVYNNTVVLTPAFYTRNGTLAVEYILECMPLYEKWIRNYPVVGFMPFADRRPTGMVDYPILRDWARLFMNAVPAGRPNRFDYWRSAQSTTLAIVQNKLGQSRAAVVLEPWLRAEIIAAFKK